MRCAGLREAVESVRDGEAEIIDLELVVSLNDVESYNA
jgi:hypothetical protein